ncbi:peroxisomal biogenesis factor 11-domain-containing protein [Dunaliella salina]|uniref:Peroxisomal biogenesis factor 11-domain-containing protein n=1 Tax=Dunaliella salina TaxID=3046 RepID=A0ABQ7GER8_DUNSA|nr:peroxisomal biogenesis factor 11-domain-containing protein [Dunaliella salina]|eukprot:KAF5833100.1 peroxisomal biogenesis factor 11-domain-containing protein [Dunaliella salina]
MGRAPRVEMHEHGHLPMQLGAGPKSLPGCVDKGPWCLDKEAPALHGHEFTRHGLMQEGPAFAPGSALKDVISVPRRSGFANFPALLAMFPAFLYAKIMQNSLSKSHLLEHKANLVGSGHAQRWMSEQKAFRLGKFLQDVNAVRHSRTTGYLALLELIAYGGEGVYYFIEQLAWLIKAGAISKESEEELSKISTWAELIGYMANICLSSIKIRNIKRRLRSLQGRIEQTPKRDNNSTITTTTSNDPGQPGPSSGAAEGDAAQDVAAQLTMLRAAKAACTLAIVQDTADAIIAINDIRGGRDAFLRHPATLAVAGLVSGCISFRKNWRACR